MHCASAVGGSLPRPRVTFRLPHPRRHRAHSAKGRLGFPAESKLVRDGLRTRAAGQGRVHACRIHADSPRTRHPALCRRLRARGWLAEGGSSRPGCCPLRRGPPGPAAAPPPAGGSRRLPAAFTSPRNLLVGDTRGPPRSSRRQGRRSPSRGHGRLTPTPVRGAVLTIRDVQRQPALRRTEVEAVAEAEGLPRALLPV